MAKKKPLNIRTEPYSEEQDTHVVEIGRKRQVDFDENYTYVKKGWVFKFLSRCLYAVAFVILWPIILKLFYGTRIRGKKNLRALKKSGAVICFNHVFIHDVTCLSLAMFPRRMARFLSVPNNFGIPVVKTLVKYFRAVPIPSTYSATRKMRNEVIDMLKKGGSLAVAPEGSQWPYYNKIRDFKVGAFLFANRASVPILPVVYCYRRQRGIWLWRKRPCINLQFLPPIPPRDADGSPKSSARLMNETHTAMTVTFDNMLEKELNKNA